MLTTSHDPLQPLRVRLVEVLAKCAELERQQPQRRRARRDAGKIEHFEPLTWEQVEDAPKSKRKRGRNAAGGQE